MLETGLAGLVRRCVSLGLIIAAVWILDAVLFWRTGSDTVAVICPVLAALAIGLTVYVRRLAGREAVRVYVREQAAKGIPPSEARHRVHELAPDGVTFDTDDVASWPVNVLLLLALAAVIALVVAVIRLL